MQLDVRFKGPGMLRNLVSVLDEVPGVMSIEVSSGDDSDDEDID